MSPISRSTLRLVAACAAGALLAGVALLTLRARSPGAPATGAIAAGPLRISATSDPAAPRVGANELRIQISDAAGAPVDGAEVELRWTMPAMGSMPAMNGGATAQRRGPGAYRAPLDIAMAGTWRLELRARAPGADPTRVEGSVTTGIEGIALEAPAAAPASQSPVAVGGEVVIDAERRQRVGIRTQRVERGTFELTLRAVGRVATDETSLVDVSTRVAGWITRLDVATLGAPVARGETLFLLYSPELLAAQQELLQALRSQSAAGSGSAPERADPLVHAARKRLGLWGVAGADIEALIRRGVAQEALPIRSPASGYVIEKNVVEGASVEPGTKLYRIASFDRVWIDAALPEADLPLVAVGQRARVSLPAFPGETLDGAIAYVYPTLDADTRTGRVRVELANPGRRLLPDMYANVELSIDRGERLLVPVSAVLYAGPRRIVFVDRGEGRLVPREIQIGAGNGSVYEVLSGLEAGDAVVSSGNFLVASESRLASALAQ
jgi:Cu(I)/Ag(I) efflux system membrane fusion protein